MTELTAKRVEEMLAQLSHYGPAAAPKEIYESAPALARLVLELAAALQREHKVRMTWVPWYAPEECPNGVELVLGSRDIAEIATANKVYADTRALLARLYPEVKP